MISNDGGLQKCYFSSVFTFIKTIITLDQFSKIFTISKAAPVNQSKTIFT